MRDETKQSDVTLGLRYTGLMRSPSGGGVCEREDGLQMAGRPRDLWMNGGSKAQACGKRGAFRWDGAFGLIGEGFLLWCSRTLGGGGTTDLSSLGFSALNVCEKGENEKPR